MPHVGCDPDARRGAGQREKKSNLKSPEKVLKAGWTEKKDAGRKEEPEGGVFPTAPTRDLPDIEKADHGEKPNDQQLSAYIPIR